MTIDAAVGRRASTPPTAATLDHFLLGGSPGDLALVDGDVALTYAELRTAVAARAVELDDRPDGQLEGQAHGQAEGWPLLLPIGNDLDSVVSYLAALALHRPVVLLEAGDAAAPRRAAIEERFGPAAVAAHAGEHPEPHPDLALLLSTSGSTGSPKLVRLSRDNLLANAASIADYLDLRPTDRAITSLPLHYCYGLSVLHSHLVAGAAVVLSELSVADACFWDLAREHHVTGLAGVPYTFDLLATSGFADLDLPHLRYVTQAGGRLAPDRVRSLAELGQARGWDLFVMYGQTEATARMAYLPPELALSRPEAVGVAVPGGTLRIHRPDAAGVGELVYAGPNVMMGYASDPADLARGADLAELFTGDLGRIGNDGLVEVVGRRDRLAKVFGLRLDLARVEEGLADLDPAIRAVADGDVLHLFTTRSRVTARAQQRARRLFGLPATAVRVHRLAALPRTSAGKIDEAALVAHARAADATGSTSTTGPSTPNPSRASSRPGVGRASRDPRAPVTPDALRDLYAVLLARPDARLDDSFVTLGGDSLSYVELSTRLGSVLGDLPRSWPTLTVTELAARARDRDVETSRWDRWVARWSAPLEIGVVLRALAILIVVVTHVDLVLIPGGAHLLLAVAGYHLARFTLPTPGRRARTRRILAAIASVAVPATLWIVACTAVTGDYHWTTAVYLNGARSYRSEGGLHWTLDWQFWFLEAIVWGFLAIAAFLAVPAVDRWYRRSPFAVAAVVVAATTALRYLSVGMEGEGVERYAVPSVLFVLALGWAAAEARSHLQRFAVLAASYAGLYGYFDDRQRELIVVGTVALLLWLRPLRLPVVVARPVAVLATSSLWIYLTHWQVYPSLEAAGRPYLAIGASLAVGVLANAVYQQGLSRVRHYRPGVRRQSSLAEPLRESSRKAGPTARS